MPFGRLHEEAAGDGKLLALSDAAWRMWGMGLIYCQKNLTDGFIPEHAIHSFGVRAPNKTRIAAELVAAQVPGKAALWARVPGGFQIHDYLQWNDSKAEILKKRLEAKDRIERWRERHARDAEQNASRNALPNAEHNAHDVVRGSGEVIEESEVSEKPPIAPPRRSTGGVMAGSLPREHLSHAACDDTFGRCVPAAVHTKLVNHLAPKYGGDRDTAAKALLAWYPTVWSSLPAAFVMSDAFKFWQGRFDGHFATKDQPARAGESRAAAVPGTDDTSRYLRELRDGRRPA